MRLRGRLVALGLGAAALCFLAFRLAPFSSEGELWPGRRVLLVEDSVPEAELLAALSKAGVRNLISESSQELCLSDYSKLIDLSLPEARARLAASGPADPRLDSYIEGLPAWFHAETASSSYRIYYLKRGFSSEPLRLSRYLAAYKGKFLFPESGKRGQSSLGYAGLGLCLALLAALVLMKGRGRPFRLALLAPWALLAGRGGQAAAAALIWEAALAAALPRLEAAFEECGRASSLRPLGRELGFLGFDAWPLLFPALGCFALESALLPSVLLSLGASLLSFLALFELARGGRGGERLGFVPLRIMRPSAREAAGSTLRSPWTRLGLAAACLGLALSVALRLLPASAAGPGGGSSKAIAGLSLPQPQIPAKLSPFGGLPSPSEAAALAAARKPGSLPDLADYLVHRAREEAIFAAPLSEPRPDPFAPLSVPSPGGREAFSKRFDSAWARAAYGAAPSRGVESLLLSEGRFVRAASLPLGAFKAQPLAPEEGLLYIILLAPPLLSLWFGKRMRSSSGRRENTKAL